MRELNVGARKPTPTLCLEARWLQRDGIKVRCERPSRQQSVKVDRKPKLQ